MSKYILPTFTGKLFDLENPTEDMICIEDIAHHLSLENRYNGATKFPYSVAQHSLLVASLVQPHIKLEALLHDAEEAYYKDFPSPWKKMFNRNLPIGYWDNTVGNSRAIILTKFRCSILEEDWDYVKVADLRAASTEILQLLWNFPPENWQHMYNKYPAYTNIKIYEQCPTTVEQMFKDEYYKWRND